MFAAGHGPELKTEAKECFRNILEGNTPGTAGGPGHEKKKKQPKITFFLVKEFKLPLKNIIFFCIYLLVRPKYCEKNYFTHGIFPEVGEKQKA